MQDSWHDVEQSAVSTIKIAYENKISKASSEINPKH